MRRSMVRAWWEPLLRAGWAAAGRRAEVRWGGGKGRVELCAVTVAEILEAWVPNSAEVANIAVPAALMGDRTRARILIALLDRRSLPMSMLASEAGVAPSTVSAHLARLVEGGLLTVRRDGRHRYYRLASADVAAAIEALSRLAEPFRPTSLRAHTRARALRAARSCYDHLAGHLGVVVMRRLIEEGAVAGGDGRHRPDDPEGPAGPEDRSDPAGTDGTDGTDGPDRDRGGNGTGDRDRLAAYGRDVAYTITPDGWRLLGAIGVERPRTSRPLVRYCVDWTEQAHHLSGAAGAALLDRLVALAWLERRPGDRALRVLPAGEAGLADWLGVEPADLLPRAVA